MKSIVKFVGFDYLSAGIVAEIKRNVTALIETPEGTCPGDRSYGIPQDFIGLPINVAKNQAALAVIDKLELYEPRAELREVTIEGDPANDTIINYFLIGPNEEYEEDQEEELGGDFYD